MHAIERIYSFVCQDAGYYPAYVMSDRYASLEYTGVRHYLSTYTYSALYPGYGFDNYLQASDFVLSLGARPVRTLIKFKIKRGRSRRLYIAALGLKRVILGPDRAGARKEIKFRMNRKRYAKELERKLKRRKKPKEE
jgi:rhamnosyltransferase